VRRLRWMGVVTASTLGCALVSVSAASAAVTTPGPPTAIHATAYTGGATVFWSAPVSNGGSPVLYYLATNYTGSRFCTSLGPNAGSCAISGLKVGTVRPFIRVRAVNAAGRGAVATTLAVENSGSGAETSTSTPSGTNPAGAASGTNSAGQTGAANPTVISGSTAGASDPSSSTGGTLPFTGTDLQLMFVVGVSLVLSGLVTLSPIGRRRRTHRNTAGWLLRP